MDIALYIFISVLSFYGLLLLAVFLFQERFVFQPFRLPRSHRFFFNARGWEECWLEGEDGVRLNALLFRIPAGKKRKGVVLYLHGNQGNLQRWAKHQGAFTRLGYDFFAIDYRGYGKSSGRPSEQGLYADGEAAYRWLLGHYPEREIVLYGRSLGSGIASWLAARRRPRLVILETPFDNMPNVVRALSRLPMPDAVFRLSFPNDRHLKELNCPAVIFAGTRDRIVEYRLSQRLRPLLERPEDFITIDGAGHRNLDTFPKYHYELEQVLSREDNR
ncbi:MAG: alpha/beta hydrolase [Phaeodactylibacter sp.]|nr:alpha/beta hydrolase [Phaeodactylibacter sp.]